MKASHVLVKASLFSANSRYATGANIIIKFYINATHLRIKRAIFVGEVSKQANGTYAGIMEQCKQNKHNKRGIMAATNV